MAPLQAERAEAARVPAPLPADLMALPLALRANGVMVPFRPEDGAPKGMLHWRDFQRDYIDKRDEYLRAGVREYWIIDRFRRRMTVVRGEAGQATEVVITEQETYTTSLLPGFALPLAQLLAVADALEDAGRR